MVQTPEVINFAKRAVVRVAHMAGIWPKPTPTLIISTAGDV